MDINSSELWEIVEDREAWHAAVHGGKESGMTQRLNNNYVLIGWFIVSENQEQPKSPTYGSNMEDKFYNKML